MDGAGTVTGKSDLETVEVCTGPEARFSVIWLHGLGADGHDFEPVVPELGLDGLPAVRFVFPHAPVRPVTLNGGMAMRAWYDIRAISTSRDQDEQGIADSRTRIEGLIEREKRRGVPAERLVLAGFSQGGAMALHVGLRHREPLAGILGLSCYLLFAERLAAERQPANAQTPVFLGHGLQDPMVPHALGKATAAELEGQGQPLTWRSYPLPHSVSLEELRDVGAWLRDRMA